MTANKPRAMLPDLLPDVRRAVEELERAEAFALEIGKPAAEVLAYVRTSLAAARRLVATMERGAMLDKGGHTP